MRRTVSGDRPERRCLIQRAQRYKQRPKLPAMPGRVRPGSLPLTPLRSRPRFAAARHLARPAVARGRVLISEDGCQLLNHAGITQGIGFYRSQIQELFHPIIVGGEHDPNHAVLESRTSWKQIRQAAREILQHCVEVPAGWMQESLHAFPGGSNLLGGPAGVQVKVFQLDSS